MRLDTNVLQPLCRTTGATGVDRAESSECDERSQERVGVGWKLHRHPGTANAARQEEGKVRSLNMSRTTGPLMETMLTTTHSDDVISVGEDESSTGMDENGDPLSFEAASTCLCFTSTVQ